LGSTHVVTDPAAARVYDPTLGRFLQADPIVQDPEDPQTLNRYSYVRNNPLNLVDPLGYSFWKKFVQIYVSVTVALATALATSFEGPLALVNGAAAGASTYVAMNDWASGTASSAGIAEAATITNNPTPFSTGIPFTPAPINPAPLEHPVSDAPRIIVGHPILEQNRGIPGDAPPEAPRGRALIHPPTESPGRTYELDVSNTPKPTDSSAPKPSVSNERLRKAVDELYRPGAKIGSGSTADAIRYELKSGRKIGGRSHIIKGRERLRQLERILTQENLSADDSATARTLAEDLRRALGGR
jgi:hypothetical protein